MGPVAAKRYPGQQAIDVQVRPAQRARQDIDYGRRAKGYVFGALWETTGACWTQCCPRRTKAPFSAFLAWVDEPIPPDARRLYAILDHLGRPHCPDRLLFQMHHPRGEFVYQPKYAAYLNLIEPWWTILRSLAVKGRRLDTGEAVVSAIDAATAYWMAHRHPFVWGRRRRYRPLRPARSLAFMTRVLRI